MSFLEEDLRYRAYSPNSACWHYGSVAQASAAPYTQTCGACGASRDWDGPDGFRGSWQPWINEPRFTASVLGGTSDLTEDILRQAVAQIEPKPRRAGRVFKNLLREIAGVLDKPRNISIEMLPDVTRPGDTYHRTFGGHTYDFVVPRPKEELVEKDAPVPTRTDFDWRGDRLATFEPTPLDERIEQGAAMFRMMESSRQKTARALAALCNDESSPHAETAALMRRVSVAPQASGRVRRKPWWRK